nr:alpha/beta hydrolase [Streptomyces acidiscabies]
MLAATHDLTTHDHWPEWSQLHCPTLVVRGAQGTMPASEPLEMQARRPDITHLTTIPNAGHDVHLDRPNELYETVAEFVSRPRSSA